MPAARLCARKRGVAEMAGVREVATDEQFLTTTELVEAARGRLSAAVWDYVCGGAETEATLIRNRSALDAIAFRPRVLRDVERVDTGRDFLGRRSRLPVLLAPVGGMTQLDPQGALPAALAAAAFGCPVIVSSVTEPAIEKTAAAAGEQFIAQLYIQGDQAWVEDRVAQLVALGARSLCVTVDVAHYGRRERGLIERQPIGARPLTGFAPGDEFLMRCDWPLVEKIRAMIDIPLMIKGIATAEDARLAVDHGVDVIYVSNHGGRQLDHGRGGIDVLPEVVAAVRGKARVVVDGGFMRGTDVLKAVSMGADMVGLGKLQALALAAAGQAGVERMLELLEEEITIAMRLLGVVNCRELDGGYLHPVTPLSRGGLKGAFPFASID
jgi:isopentenyl diphosphate isomerase/L-lactate dehydrogenase-like FMN-dependent dehydrogenase